MYIYIYVFRLNVLPRFCLVLEKQRSECGMDAVTGNRSLWPPPGGTIQHHCITMIVSWLIPTMASFIMQRWSFRPLASASRRAHSSPVDKCRTSGLNILPSNIWRIELSGSGDAIYANFAAFSFAVIKSSFLISKLSSDSVHQISSASLIIKSSSQLAAANIHKTLQVLHAKKGQERRERL